MPTKIDFKNTEKPVGASLLAPTGNTVSAEKGYSPSSNTFASISTKKSTLCREVTIGGLILRMFR
jgi:hypothetical protein